MHLKRKKKFRFLNYLLFVILLFMIINFILKDIKLGSNTKFIDQLFYQSNSHIVSKVDNNLFSEFINTINNIQLSEPITILDKVFAYEKEPDVTQAFAYIQNNVVDNPRVYIYSTHPNEGYLGEKVEGYELDNTVILASILLQEKLNEKGIGTIVEERSASQYIKEHNLNYDQSYQATRVFLKNQLENNDFDLIIDLHRDAVPKSTTTTVIDNQSYAKVMFVANVNYKENIALANELNSIINNKYPTLSRGIYNKYVDNFNQDLDSNVILLELGGNYNKMEEVLPTIDALANSIEELLK